MHSVRPHAALLLVVEAVRVTCDSNVHVAEVAGLDFLRDISVEGPTRSCSKALVPGTGMAAGGLFAVSAFWLPTRIFLPPGHITQCIDIFRELFFKSSITNSPESRPGMLKSVTANP